MTTSIRPRGASSNIYQWISVVAHEHQRVDRARMVGHADAPSSRLVMDVVVCDHRRYTPGQQVEAHYRHRVVSLLLEGSVGEGPHARRAGNQPPDLMMCAMVVVARDRRSSIKLWWVIFLRRNGSNSLDNLIIIHLIIWK